MQCIRSSLQRTRCEHRSRASVDRAGLSWGGESLREGCMLGPSGEKCDAAALGVRWGLGSLATALCPQELMTKECQMGSLHEVRSLPSTDAASCHLPFCRNAQTH